MTPANFCRLALRTTDVPAARDFYAGLLGEVRAPIVELPAEVIARGARPHWLGHVAVEDVERAARGFVERGATRLGPTRDTPEGAVAILRDPGGAVVALATGAGEPQVDVAWSILNTDDLPRTSAAYCEVFGWQVTGRREFGELVLHDFAWGPGGPSVGSFVATAGRPGVHAHWLFQLRVRALAPALEWVRAGGGVVLAPIVLPDGSRVAVCDDPQGAAIGLRGP